MTSGGGLRETKKLQTWRALAHAAFELAEERGLHEFHVEDITERVGVSRRTFFNYFNRKEEAVVAVIAVLAGDVIDELRARPADEPLLDSVCALATLVTTDEHRPLVSATRRLEERYPELRPFALAQHDRLIQTAHAQLSERVAPELRDTLYPWLLVNVAITTAAATLEFSVPQHEPEQVVRARLEEAFGYVRNGFQLPADQRGSASSPTT